MNNSATKLTESGRRILSGTMSPPTATTSAKAWRGVMLEFFSAAVADFTAVFENHGVSLQLNGRREVFQRFEGAASKTQLQPGSVVVSPAGIPKTFQHQRGGDYLVVHLAPSLLIQVAEELTTDDPVKVELLNNFGTRAAFPTPPTVQSSAMPSAAPHMVMPSFGFLMSAFETCCT